ncbi:E3 SUMO-protein ligase ZBED1-like [Plectropomus leopardus]|uniref:E3 SUMO-protein ligase ZBED1-like n=1 Tax=Plectropomus leopardus TaxID=160734 RepID=UPI001C4C290E|nr:E3 SUMO-protein ligase ZBED1-like [Plectropomus leopardus]XP_042346987.1 E3 SUMO-protein ligase ZBED1-like [Plectropomus leopardus]
MHFLRRNDVCVSFIKPTLHLFNHSILAVQEDDTDVTKFIKEKTVDYLNEKYEDAPTHGLLDMDLDPRFKLRYEKAPLAVMPAGDAAGGALKKKKARGSFFKVIEGTASQPAPLQLDQAIAFELNSYLQTVPLDSEEDPLEWWKGSQELYPRLSKLAKKYFCIPATNASPERDFSTGGSIVTCLRSSLKLDNVNRPVLLAKNLKAGAGDRL